jgi:hypothetical protein
VSITSQYSQVFKVKFQEKTLFNNKNNKNCNDLKTGYAAPAVCTAAAGAGAAYHSPGFLTINLAGEINNSLYSAPFKNSGAVSLPTPTIVDPLPVIKTEIKSPSSCSLVFNSSSAGNLSNAGCSRSFTHSSWTGPSVASLERRSRGSAVLRRVRSRALKISGVERPTGGLTRRSGVSRETGGVTSSTISPLFLDIERKEEERKLIPVKNEKKFSLLARKKH